MQSARPPERRFLKSGALVAALVVSTMVSCAGGEGEGFLVRDAASRDGGTCAPATVDPTRYLRQLSLDLRGRPPSIEELERVVREGDVPADLIDEMLHAPEFLEQVREWHRALLWPSLDGFRVRTVPLVAWNADPMTGRRADTRTYSPDPALVENAAMYPNAVVSFAGNGTGDRRLRGGTGLIGCDGRLEYPPPAASGAQPTYTVRGTDGVTRSYPYYDRDGVPLPYHDAAHCPNYCSSRSDAERADPAYRPDASHFSAMNAMGADASPHELDPPGMHCPSAFPYRVINPCDNAVYDGAERVYRERREGYRMVRAYWTGGAAVRMCAYEAQSRTNSVYTGISCANQQQRDPSCGCGPNGDYCMPAVASQTALASRAEFRVRSALNEEPLRIVSSVVERDEDYFEIFTTRRSFITGPLAYLYRNQLDAVTGLELGRPASLDALPDLPYADENWHEYVRDAEHSGVLTTAAYLGRFPTWRARISHFRSSFMCRPFSPATGSLPAPDDPCTREPNLARRCGCQNCHAALEPMTAWFGRWAERSTRYLPPEIYPAFDPNCQQCALTGTGCTDRCRTQYVIDTIDADGARYAGTLRGYLYRTDMEVARIDEGPSGLVSSAIASGELQSCTVRNAWMRLLGRPMSENEMRTLLPDLVAEFNASGHRYRALVRAIVTSAAYRRVD